MRPMGRPPTGGPARPIQKFPAHPGKQKIFAPGRAGSEYPVVAITGPCSPKVVLFVNHFCHAAMIVQMQKKKSSTRSKAAQTSGISFLYNRSTAHLVYSVVFYLRILVSIGNGNNKKVRKAVPCLFDIEILRLAAFFGCRFGCISVVPIK